MPFRFVAYIDESGDEGFSFDTGSSEWFVVSAVITPEHHDKELIDFGRKIRSALGMQPKSIIHFSDMHHDRRVHVIDQIASSWLTVSSLIVNKRQIEKPEIFRAEPFRLYKYAARMLLERVSWFCRDNADSKNDCECRIIFEHRRRLSYDSVRAYLRTLRGNAGEDAWLQVLLHDIRIHWPAIEPDRVEAAQKAQYVGLQLADCVASGTRSALESKFGFTEHRYAKMLKPRVYKYGSKYGSYGLKFFPKGLEASDPRGHWLRKHFR